MKRIYHDIPESDYDMSVNEIVLSVRAAKFLTRANIETLGDLVVKTERDLLNYRGLGHVTLQEIKESLSEHGLHLGMNPDQVMRERLFERTARMSNQIEWVSRRLMTLEDRVRRKL